MYSYQKERAEIFTEDGQRKFLQIRDTVKAKLKIAGAVRMQEALEKVTGSNWTQMACVDRLVELKEIRELTDGQVCGQHRVFVSTQSDY